MTAAELGQLLKEHPKMLEDQRMFKAILMDTYPSERRNVNLLCTTHRAGVVSMLQNSAANGFLTARIVSVLTEDYDIAEDRAKWAADLWIGAFQLSTSIDEPAEPDSAVDHAETVQPHTAVVNEVRPSLFETERNATGCAIVKYLGSNISELIIPPQVDGTPVTEIGEGVFEGCECLTSVVIPEGVTQIGFCAFMDCMSLTNVVIPNSVTQIEESVFRNCASLTRIEIPESVTQIGNCAFMNCRSLIGITVPNGITQIGDFTFNGCTNLASAVIAGGVMQIGQSAFDQCDSLTIHAPIGSVAEDYAKTKGLPLESIPRRNEPQKETAREAVSGLFEVGRNATGCTIKKYRGSEIRELIIPSQIGGIPVTQIGEENIYEWDMKIENSVFRKCESLTSVVIPCCVKRIGAWTFDKCTNLTRIEIPASVRQIGYAAFRWCISLTYVNIPNGVTQIGGSAFNRCRNLTRIVIPPSVAEIGGSAFRKCESLTSIVIPDGVTQIGDWTFEGCTSLASVMIPNSVTQIGKSAFGGCPSLTIHALSGSVAEQYAKSNGISFEPILRKNEP